MNICIDTRVLEEVASENKSQKDWLYSSLNDPSYHIFLPTIVIAEFVNVSLKKRTFEETKNLIDALRSIPTLNIIGLSPSTALEAGRLQWRHRIGVGDCIVAATSITCKCKFIRTDHKDFDKIPRIKRSW